MRALLHGLVWLLLAALALPAAAQPSFPALSGRVVDAAKILPADRAAALEQRLKTVERETGRQFVVATVPDLQGYDIQDFGVRLGQQWAIGDKERDDGVILLVAPNERKVGIQVGYGLEPILTDALSSQIIRRDILPAFRAGDMPAGIEAGATAIAAQLALPPEEARALAEQATAAANDRGVSPLAIFWIFILLVVILPMFLSRVGGRSFRRGRSPVVLWGPGIGGGLGGLGGRSGGGGFGGFSGGGGGFGGGGASGGW